MEKNTVIEQVLENFQVPEIKSKDLIWSEIEAKLKKSEVKTTSTFSIKRLLPLGIAASVALALLFFWPGGAENFSSELEYKSIELPDGSTAELGPHTSLKYLEESGTRSIDLNGSAYFNVTKGDPFIVNSNNCTVKVLGTSFKISNVQTDYDVKCYTGVVEVSSENVKVNLTKGKGVNSYNSKTVYSHNLDYDSTRSGLNYQNEYLNSVLQDLKIKKNLVINNTSDENPVISYSIQSESFSDISNTLATISGLKVKKISDSSYELF